MINEILREYDRDRQAASATLAKRTAEVYIKCPEIKAIDDSLAACAIEIARAVLGGGTASAEQMAADNRQKQARRKELLKKSGFPPGYLENIYACSKCLDTGFMEAGGRCSCYKQKLISKYYRLSNLSKTLDKENFDSFDFKYYSTSKHKSPGVSPREKIEIIHGLALRFLENFGKEFANLFFLGQVGVGKTFMCNCIAKEVLDMGYTVLYAPATKLFKAVEDARFHRSEMSAPSEQIDFFYTSELLIIDDLGTEFSTLATNSALFDIVNSRILDGRPTIISSNLTLKELEDNYSDRIVSRFLEHYSFCHFLGDDIRQAKIFS